MNAKRMLLLFSAMVLLTSSLARAATLGSDLDGNGIWDDVDAYLQRTYRPGTEKLLAYSQLAASMQRFALYGDNETVLEEYGAELVRSAECAFYVGRMEAQPDIERIRQAMFSTPERKTRYDQVQAVASSRQATINQDPAAWPASCKFQVTILKTWPVE